MSDLITVFKVPEGKTAGKTFRSQPDGTIEKTSRGISTATGIVHHVPDVDHMAALIRSVSNDPRSAIMLGYIEGTQDGEPFTVKSEKNYREWLGLDENAELPPTWPSKDGSRFCARLKRNVIGSSWVLIDRDMAPGMPDTLAQLTRDQWIDCMERLLPGLKSAGYLVVPSSSGRVIVNGQRQSSQSFHVYTQFADPDDLERVGGAMLLNSFTCGLGFKKPLHSRTTGQVTGYSKWSIFDPTTFSRERLVYEGAPTLIGEGLSLADTEIEVCYGSH